ncbi:prepilin-type N-terminal cleavage/methylation domain-containing protein [Desulfovibrio aerotolerans]|uniref:Prepilin-type N-terminal cleavage/methylation domain-containing protein n=1 Tax=Solidesulfovibrio aerotolerans TaxID=295255 RepID=A0A7C9JBM7_9BACT|nr:prepilin-type N-terminal cleavage/methylation domain-containing protein [Solidesulfovibrio aerotolerans]MYL85278.1 prepilin-type N-terminal cleavage/methylation domain-containing protein [Solidesulfovibrio aerotolerans]
MTPTRKKREQHGFTLIEIIAVLVILGILAVVAVPKYLDLQTQARTSAAQGLIAAAQSQLSMGYASKKMNAGYTETPITECQKVKVSGSAGGTVTCDGGNWNVNSNITATPTGGTAVNGVWNNPDL